MGYMTDGLTFNTLRGGNVARQGLFTNAKGERCHDTGDPHSEWSAAEWLEAVVGELGEFANLRKKVNRGDFTLEEALPDIADELADVAIYLDLLANHLGVNLGEAIMAKFNRKSAELKLPVWIDHEDWHRGVPWWVLKEQPDV